MNPQEQVVSIQKQMNDALAVWFKNSGSFVLLEKPAVQIFELYAKGYTPEKIMERFREAETTFTEDNYKSVIAITKHFNALNQIKIEERIDSKIKNIDITSANIDAEHHYILRDKFVTIRYNCERVKQLIHPLFAHLQVKKESKPAQVLELMYWEKHFFIKQQKGTEEIFTAQESDYFKGAVLKHLYSIMYNKNNDNWMMTLHSSGIIVNNEVILFMSASGGGKSTLAALLHANGYDLIADDFVAADENAKVYPFPAAISVKNGAIDLLAKYYPELHSTSQEINHKGLPIRFLDFNPRLTSTLGHKIKAIVFLKYDASEKQSCSRVDKKEAVQFVLKETWVNPRPHNVSRFFNWIGNTPFYKMTYNDTPAALKWIKNTFDES